LEGKSDVDEIIDFCENKLQLKSKFDIDKIIDFCENKLQLKSKYICNNCSMLFDIRFGYLGNTYTDLQMKAVVYLCNIYYKLNNQKRKILIANFKNSNDPNNKYVNKFTQFFEHYISKLQINMLLHLILDSNDVCKFLINNFDNIHTL